MPSFPVEYASTPTDELRLCASRKHAPAGFTFPPTCASARPGPGACAARQRFIRHPRCRSKYNETAGITQYLYARLGWFKRDIIKATVAATPTGRVAPTAQRAHLQLREEINNYARWYTYYRTRLQMMKSSVGTSFSPSSAPDRHAAETEFPAHRAYHHARAGFRRVVPAKYLKIIDFNTTQAANFTQVLTRRRGQLYPAAASARARRMDLRGKLNTGPPPAFRRPMIRSRRLPAATSPC